MFDISTGAGAVVAADTKNAVAAVDDALLNGSRMLSSVIEAAQGSNLPAFDSQKLFCTLTTGLQRVVEGRGEFITTIRHLTAIKRHTVFADESFGCPEGWSPTASTGRAPAKVDAVVVEV